MRVMAEVVRGETSVGPVAIDGRTITFVARTHGVRFGGDRGGSGARMGALHLHARPAHVEILDDAGRRQVVRIHDVERALLVAIAAGALVVSVAARLWRGRPRGGKARA